MIRMVLRDDQWRRMEPHCPGKKRDPGRSGTNNQLFMEMEYAMIDATIVPVHRHGHGARAFLV
jgi:hypothetical protein